MTMSKSIGITLWLCFNVLLSYSQTFEPGNKIKVVVTVAIQQDANLQLQFSYSVSNLSESLQKVWQFYLIPKVQKNNISDSRSPNGWKLSMPEEGNDVQLRWGTPGGNEILPGKNLSGFQFDAGSLVGLVEYYSEGYTPPPSWQGDVEEDSIPGYDDLTPYGPGIVGRTVGPVMPPDQFTPSVFIDTLISYKHQSLALKWIDNAGIANSLDQKLENAKKKLASSDSVAARNILEAFVNEVEAQKDKHLTSEAYALLKFNAQYLIDRLPKRK